MPAVPIKALMALGPFFNIQQLAICTLFPFELFSITALNTLHPQFEFSDVYKKNTEPGARRTVLNSAQALESANGKKIPVL